MSFEREMPRIHIECYAGYKADERPMSFNLDGNKLMVEKVLEQWRSPESECFKVLADDGKKYLLRNYERKGEWVLERISEV